MTSLNLLSPREIAGKLSVKPVTVYAWIRNGRLPAIKLGRCVRVRDEDLVRFVSGAPPAAAQGAATRKSRASVDLEGKKLPPELHRLFWDTDPEALDLGRHTRYVVERVLEFGDEAEVRWAVRTFGKPLLLETSRESKSLSRKSSEFWQWALAG